MLEILPLVVGVILAQLSPGPNLMAVVTLSLRSGRYSGFAASGGIATGVFIWAVLFTFGIATIFDLFPASISIIKIMGGLYLLILAIRSLRTVTSPTDLHGKSGGSEKTNRASYLTGLLVVLTNPKAALMWVAISTFLASANLTHFHFLLIGALFSFTAMAIYSTYAVLFSSGFVVGSYSHFSRHINTAFALVFGALGAKLLFDGLHELRP